MKSTDTLRDEHFGVLTVLDNLDRATYAASQGAPIPVDVFADIQEFFAVFVDACHHGKEEAEVFPRLEEAGQTRIVRQLEAEHVTGRQLAAAYAEAVRGYTPGDRESGSRLSKAADAYADFLRNHIETENGELLPAMEQALYASDEAVNDAFERIEIEKIGPGTHERLHGMIGGLPARIEPYLKTTV